MAKYMGRIEMWILLCRRPRLRSPCLVAMRKGAQVVPEYSSDEPIHSFQVSSDHFLIYSVYHSERTIRSRIICKLILDYWSQECRRSIGVALPAAGLLRNNAPATQAAMRREGRLIIVCRMKIAGVSALCVARLLGAALSRDLSAFRAEGYLF